MDMKAISAPIPRTTPKIRKAKMRRRIAAVVSAMFSFTPALDILAQPNARPGELRTPPPENQGPGGTTTSEPASAEEDSGKPKPEENQSGGGPPEPQAKPGPEAGEEQATTEAEGDQTDQALSPFQDEVNLSGLKRSITMDNHFDVGGNLVVNEAGSSVYVTGMYDLRAEDRDPFDLRLGLNLGNMWFGEQAAPFTSVKAHPSVKLWNLKASYHGTLAFVANLPSFFHTYQTLGFGYSQPIGKDVRIRAGIVAGGALSVPSWDNIYLNMTTGASVEFFDFLVYGMPNFYAAAPDPIKTAYAGHYNLYFQDVEFGVQYRFLEDQYTVRAAGNYGMINQWFGARLTRTINFAEDIEGDVWGFGGATHWDELLGGRWDPRVMVGATMVFGGRHINSTNRVRYEHLQSGGIRYAKTDIPTQENPGPYGFGRSGDPEVDAQVNTAKQRLTQSSSFQEFASSYGGASTNEVIMAARFIGAFMAQVAYAHDAFESLSNGDIFATSVRRVSDATNEQIFQYLKDYVDFYETHDPGAPLPAYLRNGIAVCAGIHETMARFMRANGVDTIVASVNTQNGPHVVAIGQLPDSTALLDYGNLYETPPDTFDEAMRFYGRNKGAPVFQSQLFVAGEDGISSEYRGTYITSEGRLLHETIGIVNTDVLKMEYLGVR